jgi:hypothetical protein
MAWPKGKPRKSELPDVTLRQLEEKAAADVKQADALVDAAFADIKTSGDPADKKLYAAQYDEKYTGYEWEQDSPIQVPSEIREANPGMRFRYRAIDPSTNRLRHGDEYHGWQVAKSQKYPDGRKYGGDLILCFQPEERAASYNRATAEASSRQVRDMQEQQVAAIDRAAGELKRAGIDYEVFQPGREGAGGSPATGISVGARKFGGKTSYRGYHPEQLKEMAAKASEERRKNKVYST